MSDVIPPVGTSFSGGPCDYCTYRENAGKALLAQKGKATKGGAAKATDSLFS